MKLKSLSPMLICASLASTSALAEDNSRDFPQNCDLGVGALTQRLNTDTGQVLDEAVNVSATVKCALENGLYGGLRYFHSSNKSRNDFFGGYKNDNLEASVGFYDTGEKGDGEGVLDYDLVLSQDSFKWRMSVGDPTFEAPETWSTELMHLSRIDDHTSLLVSGYASGYLGGESDLNIVGLRAKLGFKNLFALDGLNMGIEGRLPLKDQQDQVKSLVLGSISYSF